MPEPAHPSLFSTDTLEGLRAATREAARADHAALRTCEAFAAAVAASDAGRNDDAARILAEALPHTNDLRLLFLAYQFHFRRSNYHEAERLVRRRLELAPPDSPDAARAWNNLGLIFHFRGDLDTAESMIRRALEIDTRVGHDEGIARDLGNLALIPEARGDLDAAERLTRESLAIGERIGFDSLVAGKLCNLGEIALARGHRDEARPYFVRAEALFRTLGIEKHRELCEGHLKHLEATPPSQ